MKYIYTIIILSMLTMSGCSNNGSENYLKQENEQLKQEIARLSEVKEELELDLKIAGLQGARKVSNILLIQEENCYGLSMKQLSMFKG
ncbi:hypothetical protein [Sporosarcina sp. UB5]|uniref:hypothetical protein n=1 Tax=Sporosarcina sp. UB5 TaxID=3047463 RepID=UPI003D792D30